MCTGEMWRNSRAILILIMGKGGYGPFSALQKPHGASCLANVRKQICKAAACEAAVVFASIQFKPLLETQVYNRNPSQRMH